MAVQFGLNIFSFSLLHLQGVRDVSEKGFLQTPNEITGRSAGGAKESFYLVGTKK